MSADAIKRVCFVGIGNMGWPMAERLVRAGFEVTVTDAVAGRAKAFVDQIGDKAGASLAEATKEAEVPVTMLPTSAHVVSDHTAIAKLSEALAGATLGNSK
jgi:3-hydroxyisobutyrate dehydrogenase